MITEIYLAKTGPDGVRYYTGVNEVHKGLYEFPYSLLTTGSYAIVLKRKGEQPQVIGWIDKGDWDEVRDPIGIITEEFSIIET